MSLHFSQFISLQRMSLQMMVLYVSVQHSTCFHQWICQPNHSLDANSVIVYRHCSSDLFNFRGLWPTKSHEKRRNLAGYLNPATQKAQFMNNCLPKYYKSFHGVSCSGPRDLVKLFHDVGRRRYDIQGHVSKITSSIDAILSTNNPGGAGKFYTNDYVLVPAWTLRDGY